MNNYNGMMEGLGGPVRMDQYNSNGIDPTLDACCQRDVRIPREKFWSRRNSAGSLAFFVLLTHRRLHPLCILLLLFFFFLLAL